MTNAIGIAGSLAGGLLEFARGDGGMVKRLHLGRASEAGVMAASLAAGGFEAPRTVIEGEFGFLRVFCTAWDESHLTKGLGSDFVTMSAVLKRYPCHATAHPAVKAIRDLQAAHKFTGGDIASITVTGTPRMVERHNILAPPDLMLAQYSIPFCVALALFREARDPESYDDTALRDPAILGLTQKVKLVAEEGGGHGATASHVTVTLNDGRRFEQHEAGGMLEPGELPDKFARLTRRAAAGMGGMARVYKRLMALEDEATLDWLG
jgi:2-methylcitrate dehydratase PrpD